MQRESNLERKDEHTFKEGKDTEKKKQRDSQEDKKKLELEKRLAWKHEWKDQFDINMDIFSSKALNTTGIYTPPDEIADFTHELVEKLVADYCNGILVYGKVLYVVGEKFYVEYSNRDIIKYALSKFACIEKLSIQKEISLDAIFYHQVKWNLTMQT